MLRPIRSIATLATALLSLGLLVAGGPTVPAANAGRATAIGSPLLNDSQAQTDEPVPFVRSLADVDPTAPIKPRVPVDKATVTGNRALLARLNKDAITTDRIFVKFRDDLKVRVTGDASRPIRSEAPRVTSKVGGKIVTTVDPNAALGDAISLLRSYGGRVEQALAFTPEKLRSIEMRAESIGRRQQPDLAGFMLVTVGGDPAGAAAAFNALDAVEFAEPEVMPVPAQGTICNLVDQSLQKGSGEEGANVRECNEGTDPITGNPALCTPGPVFPVWAAAGPIPPWPAVAPTTGFGSIPQGTLNFRGSTICNRPNLMGQWLPANSPVDPTGNCDNPAAVEWNVDIAADFVLRDSHPVWDCTAGGGCNSCSNLPAVYTGGGAPDCQFGCMQAGCSDTVGVYLPYCVDSTSGRGWDALCATMANIVCANVSDTPYMLYGTLAEPTPSQDNLTTYCYTWASVTAEPVTIPTTQYHLQPDGKNMQYDPCFVARGPSVGVAGLYDGAVVFTDLGDLADVSDRGIRPWGFLWEDPTNIPTLGFLQFEGATGFWNDVNCQLNAGTGTGIGNKAIGGKVLAADPSLPDNAIFARYDSAFKSYPYAVSHDCFTLGPYTPGCFVPTCCVYVCNIDPLCCAQSWDSACVAYARQAPDGYCNAASIGANWNTAACGTPDFTFKEANDLGAPFARNLQLFTTARPVCLSTSQYISLANPTKGGPIDLSQINCQAASADPDCGGGGVPVALNSTFGFLNSGFTGGGLDLAGLENWALQLPGVTPSVTRGAGMKVGLIDYSCNPDHEDLVGQVTVERGQQIFTQASGIIDPEHGTAVFGEILAADNGFGITGIAPEATGIFFPCVSINGRGRAASAILSAGDTLSVGDVLCIPLSLSGAPFWTSGTYNVLLSTVADLGVVTFSAAGNGGSNVTGGTGTTVITVGACWPGRQLPLPIDDSLTVPARTYPGDAYCRSPESNYSSDGSIAISGWGSAVCTLGYGTLFREPGTPNRNYIQNFNGTSAATGMIAGLAVRAQSVLKSYLGTPVSTVAMRNAMATNRWAQCSGVVTGTNSALPQVVAFGDFVAPNPTQQNSIGGFPKALEILQALALQDQFGSGTPYTITTISGTRLAGDRFSTARYDNNYYRVQAVRRGRGNTGAGYGRPLPYAGSALLTDIQVRASLTTREVERMFDFEVLATGRVNVGAPGVLNTLAMAYVWNNQTKRWHYLTQMFVDSAAPATSTMRQSVIGRAIAPSAVCVPEGDGYAAYVRIVTYGLGIIGPYQMWWDLIGIGTTPVGNP